jgi:hypothetical protein
MKVIGLPGSLDVKPCGLLPSDRSPRSERFGDSRRQTGESPLPWGPVAPDGIVTVKALASRAPSPGGTAHVSASAAVRRLSGVFGGAFRRAP